MPPGTGMSILAQTAATPSRRLEQDDDDEHAITTIERSLDGLPPAEEADRPKRAAEASPAQGGGSRRILPVFLGVVLFSAVIAGGWWMVQPEDSLPEVEGSSEATPGDEGTPSSEGEVEPEAGTNPADPAAAAAAASAAEKVAGAGVTRRYAAGATVGKAVQGTKKRGPRNRRRGGKTRTSAKLQPPTPKPATGKLDVNCKPWCRVYIDGKDTGKNSPATGLSLSTGRHRIRVVNPDTGLTREKDVTIQAGQNPPILIRF